MLIIVLLALTQAEEAAYPPPALVQPIRAACLIEVAAASGDQAKLTKAENREWAEEKATKLSSMIARQVELLDANFRLWPSIRDQRKDLFDNKLITQKEWDETLASDPERDLENPAAWLRKFSSCKLIDKLNTPAAMKLKAMVGQ